MSDHHWFVPKITCRQTTMPNKLMCTHSRNIENKNWVLEELSKKEKYASYVALNVTQTKVCVPLECLVYADIKNKFQYILQGFTSFEDLRKRTEQVSMTPRMFFPRHLTTKQNLWKIYIVKLENKICSTSNKSPIFTLVGKVLCNYCPIWHVAPLWTLI